MRMRFLKLYRRSRNVTETRGPETHVVLKFIKSIHEENFFDKPCYLFEIYEYFTNNYLPYHD